MTDLGTIKDLEGHETAIQALAKKKPALLIFVRHFG